MCSAVATLFSPAQAGGATFRRSADKLEEVDSYGDDATKEDDEKTGLKDMPEQLIVSIIMMSGGGTGRSSGVKW
jgi:hypothetical protein